MGDAEPQVMSECFIALLKLSGEQAPMVLCALESGSPALQELAAIALGEARIPEAFPAIKRQWQRTRETDLRGSFLLAIATLRSEDSMAFLLDQLERGNLPDAKDALIALDIYRNTTEIWQQIIRIIQFRENAELTAMSMR